MKKIGIATIIALDNYGALLQGYALLKKFNELGCDAELLDLREKGQNDCSMFVKVRGFKDILRNMRKLLNYSLAKKRLNLFSDFVKENIKLSENYPDEETLRKTKFDYDMLVTGSDQTFNLKLPVFKKAYYLGFNKDIPKISYASSFGENCKSFTKDECDFIKEHLECYKHLSIREKQGVDLAKEITDRQDIIQCVDPTMTLLPEKWKEITNIEVAPKEDYILFYSVLSNKQIVEEVKRISEQTGMKVIAPHLQNSFEIGTTFCRATVTGPKEFLGLIKGAKLVLTTSFHATVFSVIFKKPFYSFIMGEGNRIGSLLDMLGLEDRKIKNAKIENVDYEIDFTLAHKAMEEERKKSEEYLQKCIEEI